MAALELYGMANCQHTQELREWVAKIAMAPDAVAEAIAYALAQPDGVNIGEIVVRSAAQP